MLNLKRGLVIAIAVVMVIALAGCNSMGLFINAKKGDSYKYSTDTKMDMTMSVMGQSIKVTGDTGMDYSVKVDDVDASGNMSLSYTYDSIKVDTESAGTKMSFDSNKPDEGNPLSKVYGAFIGKGFTAKMTKYGEVTEVKGMEAVMNSIMDAAAANGGASAHAANEQLKSTLKQNFSDEVLASTLTQSTNILPKDDVKVGDSWEEKNSLDLIMKMDYSIKYTLDKVESGIAYISVTGTINVGDSSKPINLMGVEMKASLKGTMTGNIKVNVDNGFINDGAYKMAIAGNMSVDNATTGKMEIPMDMKMEMTYKTQK